MSSRRDSDKSREQLLDEIKSLRDRLDAIQADQPAPELPDTIALADNLPLIVWVHDAQGKQQFINKTFREFFQLGEREITPELWREMIHPEDAPAYTATFLDCVRDRQPFHERVRVKGRDGQDWRWLESWASPRFSDTGEFEGFIGCSADITDRVIAEIRARQLFETDILGILYWKMEGGITQANDAFLKMVGYSRDDLEAGLIDWRKLTPPEFHGDDRIAIEQVRARGSHDPFEKQYIRKDGSRVWVLLGGAMLGGDEGVAYVLDLTTQREMEFAFLHSQQQRRVALESAGLGTWSMDPQTRAVRWDKRCRELFGVKLDEQITLDTALERMHPDDRPAAEIAIAGAIAPGSDGRYDIEYRIIWPDDSVRWVRAVGQTHYEQRGDEKIPVLFSGVIMDITPARQVDDELRRAKEEAERANKAKDDFLATLSHELRTPLTPILLTAQTWEDDPGLSDEIREDWRMIRRNVELEARLIDDLLDLTRISRGKVRVDLRPLSLRQVLDQAVRLCENDAQNKNLCLDASAVHAVNQIVAGDPARLTQVFCNLLKNAIKFTPSDGDITVEVDQGNDDSVSVRIRDTGIGIPPDRIEQVFNAFEQGGIDTARKYGGLGLGLAICKSLIDMHNGTLAAQSEGENRGSVFTVTLPLVKN